MNNAIAKIHFRDDVTLYLLKGSYDWHVWAADPYWQPLADIANSLTRLAIDKYSPSKGDPVYFIAHEVGKRLKSEVEISKELENSRAEKEEIY